MSYSPAQRRMQQNFLRAARKAWTEAKDRGLKACCFCSSVNPIKELHGHWLCNRCAIVLSYNIEHLKSGLLERNHRWLCSDTH